jgi:putative endonuclease
MYYVYVLFNAENEKIYIGQTINLDKRLTEHNNKLGNHFTAKFDGKWILIYKEELNSRTEAIKREKQLKSFKGREFVKKHIPW